jgi:hypothetical protein
VSHSVPISPDFLESSSWHFTALVIAVEIVGINKICLNNIYTKTV